MKNEEKQRNYGLAIKLLSEQNFAAAIIAGAAATILAAVAFGIFVATWTFAYGFAAVAVGIVIGLAMGLFGRGISTKFAVAAAVFTMIGCVLGNLFRVIMDRAQATGTSPIDVLGSDSFSALARQAVSDGFSIYILYWFIATIAAVFLSRRALSRSDRLAIGLYESRCRDA
jgi:hypothetical protein